MNYTLQTKIQQLNLFVAHPSINAAENVQYLRIPSGLVGFVNNSTETIIESGRKIFRLKGTLALSEEERICPKCKENMHVNVTTEQVLRHLPVGGSLMQICFARTQFFCPHCKHTHMQATPFKAEHHRITVELETYVCDLLATGHYTLKEVAEITGLGQNTVKAIDKRRLLALHTEDGKLKKPEQNAAFLGIDEFKLHNRHKYATHIIDMATGHILWIAEGKKKQVVLDFIKHVGLEWMKSVKAVAMDMNSDFQEAFQAECPHIAIVYDHFHIVKNFNEIVVAEARKAEELRLKQEGREKDARALKRSGRILAMSRKTMTSIDKKVAEGKAIHKGSELFNIPEYQYKRGVAERYEALIRDNDLLTTVDIVKCKLAESFRIGSLDEIDEYQQSILEGKVDKPIVARERMRKAIQEIIDICNTTHKWYFQKFASLLESHMEGIITHATYRLSSGKIEGINNKIKTLRRQGYGYPDDEYFFLKLIDMSRS